MKQFVTHTFCLLLISCSAFSQKLFREHALPGDMPPKAILVELKSNKRTADYLISIGKSEKAARLLKESDKVIWMTVNDWSRNFKFCPLYFIMDSTTDEIAKLNLTNLLLDSSLHPVVNPVIKDGDSNFSIVAYGYMHETDIGLETTALMPTLCAYNYLFKILDKDHPYTYDHRFIPINISIPILRSLIGGPYPMRKYYSNEFSVYYGLVASPYNKTLYHFYKSINKKSGS